MIIYKCDKCNIYCTSHKAIVKTECQWLDAQRYTNGYVLCEEHYKEWMEWLNDKSKGLKQT